MDHTPLKIGIIGSGFIADHHLDALTRLSNVQISGIASLFPVEAAKLLQKYNIETKIYEKYQDLIAQPCDAVTIGLPNYLHEPVALAALNAGKHILIEKPLARTVAEGHQIVKTAKVRGKLVCYCENNIFAPVFSKVKDVLTEGALGQIYMGRGKQQHSGPHSAWFYKKEDAGGGSLIDLGIHDIACLVWYLGCDVTHVFCQNRTVIPDRGKFGLCEVEDSAVGVLYFQNGAQVTVEESWAAPGGYEMRIELYGTEGQIIADPTRMTPLSIYSEKGYGYAVEKAGSTRGWTFPVPDEAYAFGYPQEMKYFVQCIRKNETPLTDGVFGLKILNIVETMYKSAASGHIESISPLKLD